MNAPVHPAIAKPLAVPPAVSSLERKRLRAYIALMIGDILSVIGGFLIGGLIYRGLIPDPQALLEAQLVLPLFLTIALYQRVYSIRSLTDGQYAALRIVLALIVSAALLNFLAFYAKFNTSFSRGTFTLGLVLSGALMVALRAGSAAYLRKKWGPVARNILIIDDSGPPAVLPGAVTISAGDYGLVPDDTDPNMLDRLANCLANQEQVVVSCPAQRRGAWSAILKAAGVHGELISDEEQHIGVLGITRYNDHTTGLIVAAGPLGLRARVAKRLFDITIAMAGLIILAPVMLIAAILVKLSDGGPVFFTQQRMGRGNRYFDMLKFRSMRFQDGDALGQKSTQREDMRVTPIGAFLRRTSIDELPQLFNVLRGHMSIVGPRPHALGSQAGTKFFWEVDDRYWNRHSLKPGMTGLAQIRGFRGSTEHESDLSERLRSDLEYIANWSLFSDLVIVLRTLTILNHDNAY